MSATQLIILAGGFGTRLRSVVADYPKALAPINGTPFWEYLIESWLGAGKRKFVFLLPHQDNGACQRGLMNLINKVKKQQR